MNQQNEDRVVASQKVEGRNRKYHLDLKENGKGLFVKLSQSSPKGRVSIFLDAECAVEFYNALGKLLDAGEL